MTTVVVVELAVLDAALFAVAFAYWRATKALIERLYDRQKAMDGYVKEIGRIDLRAANEALKAVEDARGLHADAQRLHASVDRHFADPRVKRMLDG